MALIDALIDKQDNYEIIRDKVAQILANEVVNQKALAVGDSQDPAGWDFKIFTEKTNPFELIESVKGKAGGDAELANVWLDSITFGGSGDTVERQQPDTIIQIDCVSSKNAEDNASGGITTQADARASLDAERIGRLVRNILMAATYKNLGLQSIVFSRWISRMQKMQPDRDDQPIENTMVFRVTLGVKHFEFSPQVTPGDLDEIIVDIKRGELDEVLSELTIDTT